MPAHAGQHGHDQQRAGRSGSAGGRGRRPGPNPSWPGPTTAGSRARRGRRASRSPPRGLKTSGDGMAKATTRKTVSSDTTSQSRWPWVARFDSRRPPAVPGCSQRRSAARRAELVALIASAAVSCPRLGVAPPEATRAGGRRDAASRLRRRRRSFARSWTAGANSNLDARRVRGAVSTSSSLMDNSVGVVQVEVGRERRPARSARGSDPRRRPRRPRRPRLSPSSELDQGRRLVSMASTRKVRPRVSSRPTTTTTISALTLAAFCGVAAGRDGPVLDPDQRVRRRADRQLPAVELGVQQGDQRVVRAQGRLRGVGRRRDRHGRFVGHRHHRVGARWRPRPPSGR